MSLIEKRRILKCLGVGSLWAAGFRADAATAVAEEPLADGVRALLRQRWGAPQDALTLPAQAQAWQTRVQGSLNRWIPESHLRSELSASLWYEARRAGLSLSLVLGLVEVESGFRKHAISSAGAMGYAQVMPFWTRLIGDGNVSALLQTQPNLRYGCLILRHYLDQEGGDLTLALGRYNGTRGQWHYPERVLQAAARWRNEHD